jgi:sugar phosphate isomerase/epimerase
MINCPTINDFRLIEAGLAAPGGPIEALHVALDGKSFDLESGNGGWGEKLIGSIEKASLKFLALSVDGVGLFSLSSADPAKRAESIRILIDLIRRAAQLPCPTCIILPADQPLCVDGHVSYEDAFDNAFFSIGELSNAAVKFGTTVAVENPARGVLLSPLELRDFVDQINSPSLGVCFNPANASALGDPIDWYDLLDRRVAAVRLAQPSVSADNPRLKDFMVFLAKNNPNLPLLNEGPPPVFL